MYIITINECLLFAINRINLSFTYIYRAGHTKKTATKAVSGIFYN